MYVRWSRRRNHNTSNLVCLSAHSVKAADSHILTPPESSKKSSVLQSSSKFFRLSKVKVYIRASSANKRRVNRLRKAIAGSAPVHTSVRQPHNSAPIQLGIMAFCTPTKPPSTRSSTTLRTASVITFLAAAPDCYPIGSNANNYTSNAKWANKNS